MIDRVALNALRATTGFVPVVIAVALFAFVIGALGSGAIVRWWYAGDLEDARNLAAKNGAALSVSESTATGCQRQLDKLQAAQVAEKQKSDALQTALDATTQLNRELERKARDTRGRTLNTPIRGANDGEQCVNAVTDHFRGHR
jgi:uncharacterized membrane protein